MKTFLSNRKTRRAEKGRMKPAALGGAALAVTALTAAVVPAVTPPKVGEIDVSLAATQLAYPMFGIGPLADLAVNLANAAGMNPVVLAEGLLPAYNLTGGAATAKGIYDLVNALPFTAKGDIPSGAPCKDTKSAACRTAFMLSVDIGSIGAVDAVQALTESARGNTRTGFEPLANYTGANGGLTQISSIYVNNLLRPDGGLVARFPDIATALGLNPALPALGQVGGKFVDGAKVYNYTTDVTWAYNPAADFPITASPLAVANSLMATLPPPSLIQDGLAVLMAEDPAAQLEALVKVLGGITGTLYNPSGGDGGTPVAAVLPSGDQCGKSCSGWGGLGVAQVLPALQGSVPADFPGNFLMLGANSTLPLTYPMYVASTLINPLLKAINSPYLLGTPEADILTAPLRIMVNTAYDDVITPAKLDTVNPLSFEGQTYAEANYKAYDRTFGQGTPAKPTPFAWFNNPALSEEESAQAREDAMTAFTDAVKAQSEKPLFGILVPNVTPLPEPVAATVSAPAPAAAVSAPVVDAPPAEAPVADAPPAEAPAPAGGGISARATANHAGDNDNDNGGGGGHTRGHRGAGG